MSAKIFIEFVALIVRNRIYNLLKEQMLRMEAKQKYMTVPAAIRELEKIEMVRRNGRTYKLDPAITKTQKIILSSFGLDADSVICSADEISKLLATSQSLMNLLPLAGTAQKAWLLRGPPNVCRPHRPF